MTELLPDADVELLLSGGTPADRDDLNDLAAVLAEVRALAEGPAPEPTAELAAFLAAPALDPVEPVVVEDGFVDPVEPAGGDGVVVALPAARTRGPRWRKVAGGTAASLAVGLGAGALGVLPAAAQERFDRVVEQIGVRIGGHEASGTATKPDRQPAAPAEPAEPLLPSAQRPALGELPALRPEPATATGAAEQGRAKEGARPDRSEGAAADRDGPNSAAPAAKPPAAPASAGPNRTQREDDRDDEDDEREDREDRDEDRTDRDRDKAKGKGKGKPAPGDDDSDDDEPEHDDPEDEDEPDEADEPEPDDPEDEDR